MNLSVINLVDESEENKQIFLGKLDSKLNMYISKNEIIENDEWIDMVKFTMPYIEKALRNPNKNIITEEEVVKIELIKKVTVESIKHLSKNTNLISEYDKKTGDVIPSKILSAFKEENYITYENRFIYSLIKLIEDFIYIRTTKDSKKTTGKNYQKANYEATAKVKEERIKINFEYTSESMSEKKKKKEVEDKIKEIQKGLKNLKATEMYKLLESKRVTLVKSPLKMTNVLLKNVNFQYAVKLWNYLSEQFDLKNKSVRLKKEYEEKGTMKMLIDEDFYVKYLIFNSVNAQVQKGKKQKANTMDEKLKQELTERMIERIIEINPELAENELKKMIAEKYIIYKNKKGISLKPIEDIFKTKIKEYLTKIEKLRLK